MSLLSDEVKQEIAIKRLANNVANISYNAAAYWGKRTIVLSIILGVLIYGQIGLFADLSLWWSVGLFFYPVVHYLIAFAGLIIYINTIKA